jgi:hypothetical protein
LFLFIGLTGILAYSHLESRWLKTTKIHIDSLEIPGSFVNKRIIFIADIHHGPFFSLKRVESLVNRINKLEPDMIILGGDYVHREPQYIKPFFDSFRLLKATMGIYAVLGNHDHWEDAQLTRTLMERNGIKICDNQSWWVKSGNDSIKIGGVGDLWEDEQIIDSTIFDVRPDNFCILIAHNPDYLEELNTTLVDLSLSGHTHGGQMTLFGFWAPVLSTRYGEKYRYGLKKFGDRQTYITSGVGTVTPPIRFFCRPEIVLITLSNKDKSK